MNKLVCLEDFEKPGYELMQPQVRNYIESGADEEITVAENKNAFKRLMINARVLRDIPTRDLTTEVLGAKVSFPIGIGATSLHKLVHEQGEIATARVAAALDTIYILSGISTSSIEEVAEANPDGRKWLNLYFCKDRALTLDLIHRAESSGFEAFVVLAGFAVPGNRREGVRNPLGILPNQARFPYLDEWAKGTELEVNGFVEHTFETYRNFIKNQVTWEDVKWLKSNTKLPIIVKGIMTPEDAAIAVSLGVAGIFVSNYGGRQLDTQPATIDVLPEIVAEVKGQCEVYLDSGVRTGTDVFKALALGAKMVFIGRPVLWGLAVNGEEGAKRILEILKNELDSTMALAGVKNIASLNSSYIRRPCCCCGGLKI